MILVALGHEFRRDDGLGPLLLERFPQVKTHHSQGDPLDLMAALDGHSEVVIVDAMDGDTPGRIHRWIWGETPPEKFAPRLSSHTLPLFSILELMEQSKRLPERVVVYAVEGKEFGWGQGLTPEVESAMPELARRVEEELARQPL